MSCSSESTDSTQQETEIITLSSISIVSLPYKTTYTLNEVFSPAGLSITTLWSNGEKNTIVYNENTKNDFSFSDCETSTVGTKSVTISYKSKTSTFTIIVSENSATEKDDTKPIEDENQEISRGENTCVVTNFKNSYIVNSTFTTDEVSITVYNAEHNPVTVLNNSNTTFYYDAPDMGTEGDKTVTLSFTYEGKEYSVSFSITVIGIPVTDVPVTNDIKFSFEEETGTLTVYADSYPARIPDYSTTPGNEVAPPWESHKNDIKKIVISEGITCVGRCAFYYYGNFTELELPSTLKQISYDAFCGCTSLASVELPDGLEVIQDFAFSQAQFTSLVLPDTLIELGNISDLEKLEHLEIPPSVRKLYGSFYYLNSLSELILPDTITDMNYFSMIGCTNLKKLRIPSCVTHVECISGSTELEELVIPDTVEELGEIGYKYSLEASLPALKKVYIGKGVKKLEYDYTVVNCPELEYFYYNAEDVRDEDYNLSFLYKSGSNGVTVEIGKDVKSIPNGFLSMGNYDDVTKYKELKFEEGSAVQKFGQGAFYGCHFEGKLVIPKGVEIGDGCFECNNFTGNLNLIDIKCGSSCFHNAGHFDTVYIKTDFIPNSCFYATTINSLIFEEVREIGYDAFAQVEFTNTEIILPNSCKIIENEAFRATNITSLVLPNEMESLGSVDSTSDDSGAFLYCKELKTVVFPQKLKSIGTGTFKDCNIQNISSLPDNLEIIGDYAFQNNNNLEFAINSFPDTLEKIGKSAFENNSKLAPNSTKVPQFPSTLKSIGEEAFEDRFNAPSENLVVTCSVGDYAFSGCTFNSISFTSNVKQIGYQAFSGARTRQESLLIPEGCEVIESWAFHGGYPGDAVTDEIQILSKVKTIEFPSTLKEIQDGAFKIWTNKGRYFPPPPAYPPVCTKVICRATIPPKLEDTSQANDEYESIFRNSATLYVPAGSVEAYKTSEYTAWQQFGEIKSLDEL